MVDYDTCADNISDGEPDSDHEDVDDPLKLLGTWLGELENLKSVSNFFRYILFSINVISSIWE